MRRLYGVNDERTQMAKIRYMQMKDNTQRLICRTLHDHNGMVMQKLKEYGSKKMMFNHIMRKQEQKDTSIKILGLEKVTTGWCKSDSGVRQDCPLSPLILTYMSGNLER